LIGAQQESALVFVFISLTELLMGCSVELCFAAAQADREENPPRALISSNIFELKDLV
jgi:hypothetical protein